jgi:hypothetical protein
MVMVGLEQKQQTVILFGLLVKGVIKESNFIGLITLS